MVARRAAAWGKGYHWTVNDGFIKISYPGIPFSLRFLYDLYYLYYDVFLFKANQQGLSGKR